METLLDFGNGGLSWPPFLLLAMLVGLAVGALRAFGLVMDLDGYSRLSDLKQIATSNDNPADIIALVASVWLAPVWVPLGLAVLAIPYLIVGWLLPGLRSHAFAAAAADLLGFVACLPLAIWTARLTQLTATLSEVVEYNTAPTLTAAAAPVPGKPVEADAEEQLDQP